VLTGGLYRGNQATAAGGGIYAAGALTVTSASVLNNSATGSGGGVYAAGAVSVTERQPAQQQRHWEMAAASMPRGLSP
jgi:predicted outer membrane repeat protein